MVLLFLRDWRSVIVVVLTIPLSLMGAVIGLWLTGQTINLMTLGGLSLAVGILVDEATVVIENIHTQMGKTAVDRPGRPGRHGGDDRADPAGDAVHPGRVPAVVPDGGGGPRPVRAAGHLGRLRHDHGVHPVDHLRAGAVDLAAASTPTPTIAARTDGRASVRQLGCGICSLRPLPGHATSRSCWSWLLAVRWMLVPAYVVVAGLVLWLVGGQVGREIAPQVDSGQFQMRIRAPVGNAPGGHRGDDAPGAGGHQGRGRARTASRSRWPTSA